MTKLHELPTPALVLDLDVLDRNIQRMADKATALGVALRPHLKTHKCVEIAERQRRHGAHGVTVSTLYEARVFADHGFDDITWAFPVILNRLAQAADVAERVTLRLVVDSETAVTALEESGQGWHVWLKVDSGYHRAGVDPDSPLALDLARRLHESPSLTFDGILTHSGHAYHGPTRTELAAAAEQERTVMVRCADRLRRHGIDVPAVSVGSTPAMSVVENLKGITEARPGNYVFYDFTQVQLGACHVRDCAVTVLTSVISSQPGARHSVVDAGALALSKDSGRGDAARPTMGEIYADYSQGVLTSEVHLTSLSQEHGIVNAALPIGARLRVLPNHSCLTVACFDEYHVARGDTVADRWKIWRGR